MQEVYEELKRQTDENKVSIVEIQKDLQNELLIVKNFTSKIIEKEKGKFFWRRMELNVFYICLTEK